MSLVLDARRRAMLDQMGIKVWLPAPAEPAPPGPRAVQAPAAAPVTARQAAPWPAPPSVAASAAPAPTAELRIEAPQRLYATDGQADTGGWLVVADMPPGADGRHGPPLAGDAGRLLDQMLRALRLHTGPAPVHLVRVHRAAGGLSGGPASATEAAFEAAFDGWIAPLAPRLVLALGPLAAQRLLGRNEPLGRLRGQAWPWPATGATAHVVATYHPAYLLRNGADKARAWADLCLAAAQFDRSV